MTDISQTNILSKLPIIKSTDNIKIIRTAGGRSIFFEKEDKVYKKDASGDEKSLYEFYEYLNDKPDLARYYPKFYGVLEIDGDYLESLIKSSPYELYHKAEKIRKNNYLICMENICHQFEKPPWIMDLKLARPKTQEKYHISRTIHEFSIHGVYIPSIEGIIPDIIFDHKKKRELNYDDIKQIYDLIGDFFTPIDVLDSFIKELNCINDLFLKYNFNYDCSILVAHDNNKLVVKIIDCSFRKMGPINPDKNNKKLMRIAFLIDLMLRLRAIKIKLDF